MQNKRIKQIEAELQKVRKEKDLIRSRLEVESAYLRSMGSKIGILIGNYLK